LELLVIKKKLPIICLEDECKKILIEIIEKHLPLAAIYLYGSRAYGNAQECSDVDIVLDTGRSGIEKEWVLWKKK